jgi:hypothetical protein
MSLRGEPAFLRGCDIFPEVLNFVAILERLEVVISYKQEQDLPHDSQEQNPEVYYKQVQIVESCLGNKQQDDTAHIHLGFLLYH